MQPLKIGFVFDDSLNKPDGVQQYVLALGTWLSGQGHNVHYLVGETNRPDIANVHSLSKNIGVRFNGNRLSMPLPASKLAIKTLLNEQNFDVLHVQLPFSPFMAKRIIQAASDTTAVVGTFHILPNSTMAVNGNKLLARWLKRSLRRFDKIVSVSNAAKEFAQGIYGIDSTVLPNVVDYDRFHSALPAPKDTGLTILFLGRLVPRKGCGLLLEAVNLLTKMNNVPDFRVVICGKGPLETQLKRYVESKKLEPYVKFVGYVTEEDKPGYYAAADIAVFPSSGGESFGIVLLEAMASGKAAVLAGNNPGYASVMEPKPELLFDPLNAQELAKRLAQLLQNNAERKALAEWGAGYAATFDVGTVGMRLIELYKQALHSRVNVR
jgi:phosphatidyl-myo-inositol alpha-mannosyltransferase